MTSKKRCSQDKKSCDDTKINSELSICDVRKIIEKHEIDPINVITSNAFQMIDFNQLVIDNRVVNKTDHLFSDQIPANTNVINQKNAGICWACGAITMCRGQIIKKLNLNADFHLSLNHFLFWDKLEKCNYFMNFIIKNRYSDFDSTEISDIIKHPLSDGGYWHTFVNLVNKKYGMVPDSICQRRYSSKYTSNINELLKHKLREFSANIF